MIQTDDLLSRRLTNTDLRLLSVFMAVVESGGFTPAEVVLNLGQSTISRHMSDLEIRLGMRLCQRGRVGFRLTDKGRIVYAACQKLFTALDDFRADVGEISGQLVGELSVALIDNWVTDSASPLTDALAEMKRRGPNVRFNVQSLAPDDIELAVLDGRVALGVGVFHDRRPGLAYETLYRDPLELYCGRGHPLFEPAVSGVLADLGEADYVRRGYLAEEKVAPLTAGLRSTAIAHQMEGVAHMVLTGMYIGYLPVSYARRWVEEGRMQSILPDIYSLMTQIEIVTKKGMVPTLVGRTFLQLLRDMGKTNNRD